MARGRPGGGRGGGAGLPCRAGPRLLRDGLDRPGPCRAGQGPARRRRAGDHAPAHLGRVVAAAASPPAGEILPEVAGVHWRTRMDARRLRVLGRLWTATTVAHVVPFLAAAGVRRALARAPAAAAADAPGAGRRRRFFTLALTGRVRLVVPVQGSYACPPVHRRSRFPETPCSP